MRVSFFLRHRSVAFQASQKAMLYVFVELVVRLAGAGRYSFDALIRRR